MNPSVVKGEILKALSVAPEVVPFRSSVSANTLSAMVEHYKVRTEMGTAGLFLPNSTKKDYVTKRGVVIDNMDNAATVWNNAVTGLSLANSTTRARTDFGFTNSLQIAVTASYARMRRAIPGTVMSGCIDLWIHLSADPHPSANLSLSISKDGQATSIFAPFTTAQYLRSGWNRLPLHVTEDGTTWSSGIAPVVTGVTSFADSMNSIQIAFGNFEQNSPSTGAPIVVTLGGIFHKAEGRASVLVNWDDAWSSQWDIFNIFRGRGLTGCLSVIPQAVGASGLTLAQLREAYEWGWDVVNHTMQQGAGNIASDSSQEVRRKIAGCRDWMLANGFARTANVLVWPENECNDRVTEIAADIGITLARTLRSSTTRTPSGLDNPMRLGSNSLAGKTLAQAKKFLDAAEKYTGISIIVGHKLIGTSASPAAGGAAPVDGLDWYWNDYVALADDIAARVEAGTIQCINYSDILSNCRINNGV